MSIDRVVVFKYHLPSPLCSREENVTMKSNRIPAKNFSAIPTGVIVST